MKKGKMKVTTTKEGYITLEDLTGVIVEHFGIDMEKENVYIEFVTDDSDDSGYDEGDIESIVGLKIVSKLKSEDDEED